MSGQPGFFDLDERYRALSAAGDALEWLARLQRPMLSIAPARAARGAARSPSRPAPDRADPGSPCCRRRADRQLAAVMRRGVGNGPGADKPVLPIDADMALVAEHWHRDLDLLPLAGAVFRWWALAAALQRPACIAVDLRPACRRPAGRRPAIADRPPSPRPAAAGRAWITVASRIWPPIASRPLSFSAASNRRNR